MKLTTVRRIRSIRGKLWDRRLLDLPADEIGIYLLYRVEELVKLGIAISYREIRYNLCEAGPGKRRLDPWSLDILLTSNLISKLSSLVVSGKNNACFFYDKNSSRSLVRKIVGIKTAIIRKAQKLATSKELQENLKKLIIDTVNRNNCIVSDSTVDFEKGFVQCEVHHHKIKDKNLLIRFYNTDEWIYPDGYEIWSLFEKGFEVGSIPILLAPNIHGSCFQLFKDLGMFARSNYYVFLSDELHKVIDSTARREEKEVLDFSNFKLGRYESVKSKLAYGEFDVLAKLLSITIPKYYESFCSNLDMMSRKIVPLLGGELKFLLVAKKRSEEIKQRVQSLKKILMLVKLEKVIEMRKMIRRNEKLIKSLNYTGKEHGARPY